MAIIQYISSIVSSVSRKNNKKNNVVPKSKHDFMDKVSKEQYLKWVEEGKCGCCGSESGEFKGICDECRLS